MKCDVNKKRLSHRFRLEGHHRSNQHPHNFRDHTHHGTAYSNTPALTPTHHSPVLPFAPSLPASCGYGGLRPAPPAPPKACFCPPFTHTPNHPGSCWVLRLLTPDCTHESIPSPQHRTPALAAAKPFLFIAIFSH